MTWALEDRVNTLHTDESAQFSSAFSPTTISVIRRCRRKLKILLRFSPKTLSSIRERGVTKRTLSFAARLHQQRAGMLHALGKNREKWKNSNIWANLKKIVGCNVFGIY